MKFKNIFVTLIAMGIVIAPLGCAQKEVVTESEAIGTVVVQSLFVAQGDVISWTREGDVYVMNAIGSDQTNLTNSDSFTDDLSSLSADGSKITFISDRAGGFEVFVMNVDGSDPKQITFDGFSKSHPRFSPDNSKILYASFTEASKYLDELFLIELDSLQKSRLTDNDYREHMGCFSPDGKTISFVSDRDGNYEIYTMNLDGAAVERMTFNEGDDFTPSFSPDSKTIVYASERDGKMNIYLLDMATKVTKQISNTKNYEIDPTFSGDGSKIVFATTINRDYEIYVMDADGGNSFDLSRNRARDSSPSLSAKP